MPVLEERRSLLVELREGLGFVLRHPYVRSMAASVAIFNFFGNVGGAILLVYAVRELDLSAATIGIVLALGNIGFLAGRARREAGGVRARRRDGRSSPRRRSSAPGLLLVPLAPKGLAVPFFVASGLIVGFAIVLYNVTAISLMQAITPDRMLGRMNASRRFLVWGVIPLGGLVGGVLATTIGLRATLFVGAIGGSLAVLPLLFSPLRSLERVPDEVQSPAERLREECARITAPRQPRLLPEASESGFHGGQSLRLAVEPLEPRLELRPPRGGVQVLGQRGHRAAVELELTARVAAGHQQQLRAPHRRTQIVLVERDAAARQVGERQLRLGLGVLECLEQRSHGASAHGM